MDVKLRKLLVTGAAIVGLLLNVSPVFAGTDASAEVGDDGNSHVYTEDNDKFKVDVDNHKADLFNIDAGAGVSGFNYQDGNDDENSMETGDTEGEAETANFANSSIVYIEADGYHDSADADSEVGEDGNAKAKAYDNDDFDVEIDNHAGAFNLTLGLAVSGFNTQSANDDDNEIETGDADAMASTLNELNSSWVVLGGSHSAHASASVGDDGDAIAHAYDNDKVDVDVNNRADLLNVTAAVALTGGNSQSGNDDGNSIGTGKATATAGANNYLNSTIAVVGDSDGEGSATADAGVGEDGNATSRAEDNDRVDVDVNNNADLFNVSAGVAVSGGNEQSGNDDGNTLTTGNSSGSSCSTNNLNGTWIAIGGGLPKGEGGGCN